MNSLFGGTKGVGMEKKRAWPGRAKGFCVCVGHSQERRGEKERSAFLPYFVCGKMRRERIFYIYLLLICP